MTEQTKEQTDRATIFAKWPNGRDCFFPYMNGEPVSLSERVQMVATYGGDGFVPVAWAQADGFRNCNDAAREQAIAAGRVIKLIDGKYVPFGVEAPTFYVSAETLKPAEDDYNKLKAAQAGPCDPAAANAAICNSPLREPLDWNRKTKFDAFPGYEVERYDADDLMPAAPTGHPTQRIASASAQTDPGHALAAVRQLVR